MKLPFWNLMLNDKKKNKNLLGKYELCSEIKYYKNITLNIKTNLLMC